MPRASRYLQEGYTYHLTHRCHDRRFLLQFKEERDTYREWLRVGVKRYKVPVYGYCVTSNHVHVVVHVDDREAVASMMRLAAGATARHRNRRKGHEGSVWEHPYQCTMIESGRHLLNCLRYVDLNMVRTGLVPHPDQWRWCGFDELTGRRKRYRLIDMDRLLYSADVGTAKELGQLHAERVRQRLAEAQLQREAHWTESLAVGGEAFVEHARQTHGRNRREFSTYNIPDSGGFETWCIRETQSPYTVDSGSKDEL